MKVCKFDSSKRCFHNSCSFLDSKGNVVCCRLLRNPSGLLTPRRSVGSHPSVSELLARKCR